MDYKKAAGFQQHMKKTEALSHFSKSKSMMEQREFLPIFQVKDDLLRVIRDNQVRPTHLPTDRSTDRPFFFFFCHSLNFPSTCCTFFSVTTSLTVLFLSSLLLSFFVTNTMLQYIFFHPIYYLRPSIVSPS